MTVMISVPVEFLSAMAVMPVAMMGYGGKRDSKHQKSKSEFAHGVLL
jgi:hypothetical protein